MLCGAESSTITRVKSGRKKFRELLPLLTTKSVSLKVKGELYAACVRSVMLYGSLRWFGHSERRGCKFVQSMVILDVINHVKPGNM